MKEIYSEKPVQIIVNGRATLTLMTHADDQKYLVLGALYTEKVIPGIDEIDSLLVQNEQVSIVTKNPYSILLSRKTVLAGCGGASSFLDSGKLGTVTKGQIIPQDILKTAEKSVKDSIWFSAGLFSENGKMIGEAEDISSQNVVDQLVGIGLEKGVEFSSTFIVLKGNCVVESMRKVIIAGIPVLKVIGAVTDAAKIIAESSGVTLIL